MANHKPFATSAQGYLTEVDIFCDLRPEEVAALGEHAPMRQVLAGTQFYTPLEQTEVLFILKAGRVRLYQLSADGKALTTAILESGTIFGEMALMGQGLSGSYAEALSECVLCLMSREDVKTLLFGDPRIALRIAEIMGRRLQDAERRLADFAFKRLPERVANAILQFAQPRRGWFGRAAGAEWRCTHNDVAELTGTYRETATKVLNDLQQAGYIELYRGKIVLVDAAGLQHFASGAAPPT
jgi:CRP-like cAMP-binding protein